MSTESLCNRLCTFVASASPDAFREMADAIATDRVAVGLPAEIQTRVEISASLRSACDALDAGDWLPLMHAMASVREEVQAWRRAADIIAKIAV